MNARFATAAVAAIGLGVWLCPTAAEAAQITVTTPASFDAALASAGDGDEILLAPGTYHDMFGATGLVGVTIRSLDPDNPAVIDATGRNEGLLMRSCTRLTIQDLIVQNADDNGINVDGGGGTPSQDLTLRNLIVRDTDPSGNNDGIKLSSLVGFHVDRVRVTTWGGSAIDMVGCHDGLIENSYFQNQTLDHGTGIRPKGGSTNIIIRANRIVDGSERPISIGGSTGLEWFYPQPPGSVEADDITAEGNVVVRGRAGVCYINIDGGIVARNNFFYRLQRWVIRIQKENLNPGFVDTANGTFIDNVIVWHSGDIHTFVGSSAGTHPETFTFARNQWYNATSPGSSTPTLPAPETDGVYGVDPGLDIDRIIPWTFDWGIWLVNANDGGDARAVTSPDSLRLARPGEGAELDIGLAYPLIGEWTFSALEALGGGEIAIVSMEPFSQAVLVDVSLIPDSAKLPGDADVDGDVDRDDLAAVAANWGSPLPSWAMGDFDDDDAVDLDDMITIARHWTGASAPAAVPEPATAALLAFAAAGLARRRRTPHGSANCSTPPAPAPPAR